MSEKDVRVMEEFFECFANGDIAGCMSRMHEDCVLVESGGLPHSGTYVGAQGFLELVTKIGELFSTATLTDCTVHDAGEFVVARMTGHFTSRANGLTVSQPVTEHYWLTDGRISRADVYYKNPKEFDALVPASR